MWKFNYGEWTEAYVFLRLLGNGRIYGANGKFERDESAYLDIIKIIRHEKNHVLEFKRIMEDSLIVSYDNGICFKTTGFDDINKKADFLYNAIRNVTSKERKFDVPEIEEYLEEFKFSQPKVPKLPKEANEKYGDKTDIILEVGDSLDHAVSSIGFSIKSHMGSSSSLFNSSLASRFKYEIVGCTDSLMDEINGRQIDSETGMISFIRNNPDLSLEFIDTSEKFKANLDFIELTMSKVLSTAILIQIGYYDRARSSKTKDIVERVSEMDPIGVSRPKEWYKAKFKSFLYATFSGLTASEPWDGRHKLSGGYIDVSKEGEMLYYRAISDDIFNSYLYENTFIDRPSRGLNKERAKVTALAHLNHREPTEAELNAVTFKNGRDGKKKDAKGDWGYVIKEGDKFFINLNFQIRFQ